MTDLQIEELENYFKPIYFVANDDGDIIGHDMCEAKAKALAAEMQEKEPDASREAMNGEDE